MKILGLIPARGGSVGIPGKNIKLLNGKPLLAYTVQSAFESTLIERTILSTDDEEIAAVGRELGLDVPFLRPGNLAQSSTPTLPAIVHCLEYLQEKENVSYDAVCLLQPTTPFRNKGFIDQAIQKFTDSGTDSLVSVLEVPHEYNPEWVFFDTGSGHLKISTGREKIISRRQELPSAYIRDGAIYLTKTNVILEQESLYGSSTSFIKSDPAGHVNLDTMEDWYRAEQIVKNLD